MKKLIAFLLIAGLIGFTNGLPQPQAHHTGDQGRRKTPPTTPKTPPTEGKKPDEKKPDEKKPDEKKPDEKKPTRRSPTRRRTRRTRRRAPTERRSSPTRRQRPWPEDRPAPCAGLAVARASGHNRRQGALVAHFAGRKMSAVNCYARNYW